MLPEPQTANGTVPTRAGRADSSPEERPRAVVLLVDDYKDCRDMYGAGLEFAGFTVLTAGDGFEALLLAGRVSPDLILMDLGLPGIDGCETTRRLKEDPRTATVPVIALTAQPLPPEPLGGLGFDGVITKPCLPDALADHVWRALVRRERRDLDA